MAIFPPTPLYSKADKRLLALLAQLLLERMEGRKVNSNLSTEMVALTDAEADELVDLLEKLVNSRQFAEACFFVEGLTHTEAGNELQLRETYLSARKRRGRTRALASNHWAEFQIRLGIGRSHARGISAIPMKFEYFEKMEERLLSASELHPRVQSLISEMVHSQAQSVENIRTGQKSIPYGTVKPLVADPVFRWRDRHRVSRDTQLPTTGVAAAITIIANASVLFTTRDWSVAGTLSTMAGALAALEINV